MKRAILLATIATCSVRLAANPPSGAAEAKAPLSAAHRAIAIEVLIVRVKGGGVGEQAMQLSGRSDEVAARLRELESKGQIVIVDRIRLTTVENQPTLLRFGIAAPVARARSSAGRGGAAQTAYEQRDFGTQVSATARTDGDAIVVELELEKSELEQRAGQPKPDDEFAPLATETFTSRATLRIGAGKTVLASSLENRADAEPSAQLVLASARLLEPSTGARDAAATNGANGRPIRIFSLQHAAAKDAAAIIKELSGADSGEIRLSVDSRANSLIVSAEKKRDLDLAEAILVRLDESSPKRVPSAPTGQVKPDSTSVAAKYDKMNKERLREELKTLQNEALGAERMAKQARANAAQAERAYQSASDAEKADALLHMIEADAASRKPMERLAHVSSDLAGAKRAYLQLLVAEQ